MKKNFLITRLLPLMLALILMLSAMPAVFAERSLIISQTTFPDLNFRNYITATFDKDGDGEIPQSELLAITEININSKDVRDISGLQYFTELKTFSCDFNRLTVLDVSKNTKLTKIYATHNDLMYAYLSNCKALTTLCLQYNDYITLDLSGNPALTYLDCSKNDITALDVSANTALETLYCDENVLTSLDVSGNLALQKLFVTQNQLESLQLGNNTSLTLLDCNTNKLTSLDVSGCTALEGLYCDDNELTILDVSANTALSELSCSRNQLTKLDLERCTNLTSLYCEDNSYEVVVGEDRFFDMNTLPAPINGRRVPHVEGGMVDLYGRLTFDEGSTEFTYTYEASDSFTVEFKLIAVSAPPAPQPVVLGDVNNDGNISPLDASLILQYDAQLLQQFPNS